MLFYKILVQTDEQIDDKEVEKYNIVYHSFFEQTGIYTFLAHQENDALLMASISNRPMVQSDIYMFLAAFHIHNVKQFTMTETQCMEFNDLLRLAMLNRYGRPFDDISLTFDISFNSLTRCLSAGFFMPSTTSELRDRLKKTTYQQSLKNELKRINDKRNPKEFLAHPTHYIITGSHETMMTKARDILLESLYNKNRIMAKSYITINVSKDTYDYEAIKSAFTASKYGAVVIQVDEECNNNNTTYAFNDRAIDSFNLIAPFINEYKNKVLIIFMLPHLSKNLKNRIYEYCEIPFIEIEENLVKNKQALAVLEYMAASYQIEMNDDLSKRIKKNTLYSAEDLYQLAVNWYDDKVYNELYPAYNNTITKTIVDEKPVGSAYEELMDMVGLVKVKDLINKAINYRNVCKIMEDRNLVTTPNSFHMVFTGNPGTAKTTVARLFARILKENGVLSEGKLIECGRADLVGKYVGWTADLVKEKFKEAKGSVLFIDEAYSLLDGDHNTFGIEAINCIVQEMENNREDTIVIFAGYPDEMKDFLEKNPGMNSRIAFHIDFDNYNEEELFAITELMAKKMSLKLDKKVKNFLIPTYKEAMESKTFGNGRYVRNLLENAMLNHCDRVSKMDLTEISNDDLVTIQVDDFEIKPIEKDKKMIGFR